VPFDVKILKGDPDLAGAALAAVKNWRFKPYKLNGEPVEVESEIVVRFHRD